jgi:BlaI family penicillinase repressor
MDVVLHDREMDLMEVLWEKGPATVAEVRDAVEDKLAYNTVLTMLCRMEEKGYVGREEIGRAHRYFPVIERDQVRRSALRRTLDRVFGGSPELLLNQLVSDRKLSHPEIRRLRQLLRDQLPEDEP